MEVILSSVLPGSFHRGVFPDIEIIHFRYSRKVWISHILFHCQACVLAWGLGKKVQWARKVSKDQEHLWVLTGFGCGRFGESAAFARGHFEKKFLIWFCTSYSWTGLLFQLSMGFMTQFILWKASGNILFWNAQGEPQWNAFLMSTAVLSKSCHPGCILDPVMIIWNFFSPSWGNNLYFVMEKMRTIRMFSRLDTRYQNTGDVGAGSLIIFPIPCTVQSLWFTIPAFLGTKLLSLKKKKPSLELEAPFQYNHGIWAKLHFKGQPWMRQEEPTCRKV